MTVLLAHNEHGVVLKEELLPPSGNLQEAGLLQTPPLQQSAQVNQWNIMALEHVPSPLRLARRQNSSHFLSQRLPLPKEKERRKSTCSQSPLFSITTLQQMEKLRSLWKYGDKDRLCVGDTPKQRSREPSCWDSCLHSIPSWAVVCVLGIRPLVIWKYLYISNV